MKMLSGCVIRIMKDTFAKFEEMAYHIKGYMNNHISTVKLKTVGEYQKYRYRLLH